MDGPVPVPAPAPRALRIEFMDPTRALHHEHRSKMLRVGSQVHTYILTAQEALLLAGLPVSTDRPPHIAVSDLAAPPPSDAVRTARALELHGRVVPTRIERLDDALVLATGPVTGHGPTHATIAFMRGMTAEMEAHARRVLGAM